ncbi:MAG: peptide chain release factor 2 [Bacilli bacterium]|nr:peptide chain release factor 2 [Bacilli bacterium]
MICGGYFDIDSKKNKIEVLEAKMLEPNFWDDSKESGKVIENLNSLKSVVKDLDLLVNRVNELKELISGAVDDETHMLIEEEVILLRDDVEKMELLLLLDGEYDGNNCILEVHSGAGGTEACDWALMLYRMYTRWCDKKGYKYTVIDYQDGDEVGIKSASLLVNGINAYGYLKCEKGIHRLVRLSPFDANNKRHTSFASVDVTPEFDDNASVEINEKDLKIDVYRSSGCGGQGVNTTDSAVRITHLPTKIVVTCQNERSQIQNKEQAMKMLRNKLMLLEIEKKNNELNQIRGELKNIEFGSQIRSYVMHPYSMVKDHRTSYETSNVQKVLDGEIDLFIEKKLKEDRNEK